MPAFILSDTNLWFSAAIAIVLVVFLIELLGMFLGASILGVFDDVEVVSSPDAATGSSLSVLSNWLCLDKLPFMIWMIIFLTFFGLCGLMFNVVSQAIISSSLPVALSIPLAFAIALPLTARFGLRLARLLPKNESSALSADAFVGVTACITSGKAQRDNPAEAKFIDQHQQPHYVLVEPIDAQDIFVRGDNVILVEKAEGRWLAMRYQ
ncbi:YqiJ family protein [Salinimonas sp. HHU 13199]|uniref:YqiJ family protein n=1 Tax=Salinimonas profundi TaxID=2729140 RepID=A0ABR8LET2_9ALTE|nr:YqiJ family protein [Salinimonas profundi]MBD3584793.1 YqiJ family protein [Salinimonas profundi]